MVGLHRGLRPRRRALPDRTARHDALDVRADAREAHPSGPRGPRELFVDDGDVLTSAGTAAGIDLSAHRADRPRRGGGRGARPTARRTAAPHRRPGTVPGPVPPRGDRRRPAGRGEWPGRWSTSTSGLTLETLAARAYMDRQDLRPQVPVADGQRPAPVADHAAGLRVQRLLETSDYSVDEVAGRCGFHSPVALRGHFRRQLGSSPPRTGPPTGPAACRATALRR